MVRRICVFVALGLLSVLLSSNIAPVAQAQEGSKTKVYLPVILKGTVVTNSSSINQPLTLAVIPTPTPTLVPPDDSSETQTAPSPAKVTQDDQSSSESLVLLETLSVPADGTLVQTSFNLVQDDVYVIRVSGVFKWGNCDPVNCPNGIPPDYIRLGDAEYLTDDNWQSFSDQFWSQFIYLEVNGSDPNFGPFNPNHIYSIQVVGNGQPATFRIQDCSFCYPDNAGALTVEVNTDITAVKTRFLNAFGELQEVFKPFDQRLSREELLANQATSLRTTEEAVASARLLPGATLPSVEDVPLDLIHNLIFLGECLFVGLCHPFILPILPNCPPSSPTCFLDFNRKRIQASEFDLFSFNLSVQLEKSVLESFKPGDRFVTATPFLGIGPSFSIVEVTSVIHDNELGTIEFMIEGVSAIPEQVEIDIKPGGNPNPINPNSKGNIPVAILSTTNFDASVQIDKTSLTFGRFGNEKSLAKCNKDAQDVNGDGLLDQVCHFNTQNARFQQGDNEGILTGIITNDVFIQGRDLVKIVPEK